MSDERDTVLTREEWGALGLFLADPSPAPGWVREAVRGEVPGPERAEDDDSVMRIYLAADSALTAGRFGEVDAMLAAVDVPATSIVDLLAWVSITQAASEHLPGRAAFVANVRQHLTATDPERVEALMRGFS